MSELISGKDALNAWFDGETVFVNFGKDTSWYDFEKDKFRLKPRTITINNIEVPAPFKPKYSERFYTVVSDRKTVYDFYDYIDNVHCNTLILNSGAWRSEEEIKQVVAALREVFK